MKKKFLKISKYIAVSGLMTISMFGSVPHKPSSSQDAIKQLLQFNQSEAQWHNLTLNITNNIRNAVGMIVGYGSRQSYVDFVCPGGTDPGGNQSCDGPPQNGIVGTLTDMINQLPSIGSTAGITSCEAAPSTGTYTGHDSSNNSVSLHFETPTHTIPAGWIDGGTTFSHRVKFSMIATNLGPDPVTIAIAYEFNCGDSAASYTAVGMDVDTTNLPGWKRDIALFNGQVDASTNGIQLFMAEHLPSDATKIRAAHAVDLHYNPTTNIFNIWGVTEGNGTLNNSNGFNVMLKINGNGNYSTGAVKMSAHAYSFNSANGDNTGKIDSAVTSMTGASSQTVEADPSNHGLNSDLNGGALAGVANGSPADQAYLGCINFSTPDSAAAPSDSACSGFSLSAPADSTPAISGTGHWTVNWAVTSMAASLENI